MKRLLATVLSVCMLSAMLAPATVSAAETVSLSGASSALGTTSQEENDGAQGSGVSSGTSSGGEENSNSQADEPSSAGAESSQPEEGQPQAPAEENGGQGQNPEESGKAALTGSVVVELQLKLLPKDKELSEIAGGISAVLVNEAQEEASLRYNAQKSGAGTLWLEADQLPVGNYQVRLSASGYVPYTQNLTVRQTQIRLTVSNSHETDSKDGSPCPGVFALGDGNGDGVIDAVDKEEMMQAMLRPRENQEEDGSLLFDLNGDGVVDIEDFAFLSRNLNQDGKQAPVVESILPENIQPELSEGTKAVQGSVEDLLAEGAGVSLAPQNDQAISEQNPIVVTMNFEDGAPQTGGFLVKTPVDERRAPGANAPVGGVVRVEDTQGNVFSIPFGAAAGYARARTAATATVQPDGTVVVDLGGQVAVKKIIIEVTETAESTKLADISQVEFLNDMEKRIPPVEMDIPTHLTATAGDKEFTLHWTPQKNVTGYEVQVQQNGKTEYLDAGSNTITIQRFQGKELVNDTVFTVRVQSVNGDWSSGFCDAIQVTPKPSKAPDAPEGININGGYKQLTVSWNAMKDTNSYTLYYKVSGEPDDAYQKIENLTGNSVVLTDLENETEYTVCMTGHNDMGTSPMSREYTGKTIRSVPKIPQYKLINTSNGKGVLSAHIEQIQVDGWRSDYNDTDKDPSWVADNDYETHWTSNANAQSRGATVTFDQEYEMNSFILNQRLEGSGGYGSMAGLSVTVWDAQGNSQKFNNPNRTGVTGGINTYQVNIPLSKVKKIRVEYSNYYNWPVSISELHFYHYDSLEDEVNGLYTDAMHLALAEDVTDQLLDSLETRANAPDPVSGENHPKQGALLAEIQNARELLHDVGVSDVLTVDQQINASGTGYLNFSYTLNTFQPLGIVAREGETICVYVGQEGKKNGEAVPLRLVTTQYHGESSRWKSSDVALKQGKNEITVPRISSRSDESGGSVYIKYSNAAALANGKQIQVRVSGGSKISVLNAARLSGEERKAAVRSYIQELNDQVYQLEQNHALLHTTEDFNYDYHENTCILNATEIGLENMLYSVAAKPFLKGLGITPSASLSQEDLDAAAGKLMGSLQAMDDMLKLFFRQKGLNSYPLQEGESYGNNKMPVQRLNIRYHTMFSGAFMYAGGEHIGIEYGSVSGLASSTPVKADENGKYISGNYFGWGIAHEIGHVIDQAGLVYGETTNNIFSQFAKSHDTADTTRIPYEEVYQKVTSGTRLLTSNVFANLGMFWQLHLAYDNDYLFKTYDSYAEQQQALFYARFYAYKRTPASAPNGLKLAGNADQDTIRLACAAANRDLTEYFIRWGLTPNEETLAYASQFEKETRDICYLNDGAHEYTLGKSPAMSAENRVTASLSHETANGKDSKKVTLTLGITNPSDTDAMLGYEIQRNGVPAAFVTADQTTYTDVISAANNRVFTYTVVGYDKYLNKTEPLALEPVKISHDGSLPKDEWTMTTNMTSADDVENDLDQCAPVVKSALYKAIDDDSSTSYSGTSKNGNAYFVIDMKTVQSVVGLKYTAPDKQSAVKGYNIYVSTTHAAPSNQEGAWTLAATGTFSLDENNSQTVYFNKADDPWMYTYDATYIMFVAKGSKTIHVQEVDVIGPPGDNIEILAENGIGALKEDYVLDAAAGEIIPRGSFLVTGEYRGNPAYNAVKLYDENGKLISGTQVIFAQVPEHGELGEISSGTWIYYIEPDENGMLPTLPTQVRAELYRVNDALTNAGERLVSDTLITKVPDVLPEISLKG